MPGVQLGSRTDGDRSADHCSLPSENDEEISPVRNSLSKELRELVWLTSMIGTLSMLSVLAGVGMALLLVGVT
jgi:hypothetical protein